MAILDAFGRPARYSHQFARAAARNAHNRPYEPVRNESIEDLVPAHDRLALVSGSRRLYLNMGLVRGAIDQKASFAVGRGWSPVFAGTDTEWGKQAEEWLLNSFYPIADVKGPGHDFVTSLFLDSVAVDRDGGVFILLTESENGWPQIQHLPTHRVGQRSSTKDVVEAGPFKGRRIRDGVIKNKFGRPIGYRVLGEAPKGEDDQDVSASDIIHVYDPAWHESGRGLPALTHAITDLRDMLYSQEWETMALLQLSALGLIETNETGMIDPSDPATQLIAGATADEGLSYQTIAGGTVRHFRAGSGSKLETMEHDRPGDAWDRFQDRLARSALAGMNWPYTLAWKPDDVTGTTQRTELQKARSSVEDRQDLLRGPAKRIVSWAVRKAIKRGILPDSDEWYRWSFSMPPEISIDPGRDSKTALEEWRAGIKTMTTIVGERGRTVEDHYRERAVEIATRKRIQREVEEETGEEIEDREMSAITPNETPDPSPGDTPEE